jgi:type II restriction/modification system DNA methylase subunit YeeA
MQVGNVSSLPFAMDEIIHHKNEIEELVKNATDISFKDWASNENTYEFKNNGLVSLEKSTESSFLNFLKQTKEYCENLKETEYKINKIFNSIYEVDEEVSSTIENRYVTLNSNPHYRYGGDATEEQLEQRLQSDTIAELISYAIGCMMGRYSLDRVGLVYAHEGNVGFDELVAEGAYKKFPADEDGILPLLDEERFPDDVYSRFEQFIATAWDKETLQQNLDFIAESLRLYNIKPKNGESSAETIRRYLSNHFYKDQHLKTYKSRPIYWLFSSGKQKAFECLVYMHRFNETTLAKMRTQYVLPLMGQLTSRAQFLSDAEKDTSLSPAEKTKYAREADNLHKKLNELKDFDAELKHHIEQKISIDLDDGVKVNYGKFAKLLAEAKKVTGNKA